MSSEMLTNEELEERLFWRIHDDHKILVINISHLADDPLHQLLEAVHNELKITSEQIINSLIIIQNTKIDPKLPELYKKILDDNKSKQMQIAIVGASQLGIALGTILSRMTKAKIKFFKSETEALDWLIKDS